MKVNFVQKTTLPCTRLFFKICWDSSLVLPPLDGQPNIGVAGAFSGYINEKLLIIGGANFPDRTPLKNGEKQYHRALFRPVECSGYPAHDAFFADVSGDSHQRNARRQFQSGIFQQTRGLLQRQPD